MADLTEYFDDIDLDAIEASTGRVAGVVPTGDYLLQIIEEELKATSAGTGLLLNYQAKVVDGEFEGRMVFGSFNVKNTSAQAQTIGIGELKALCLAINVPFDMVKSDTSLLLFTPFRANVGLAKVSDKKNDDGSLKYPEPKNQIKKFYPHGEVKAAVKTTVTSEAKKAAPPAATKAEPKKSGLPWKK